MKTWLKRITSAPRVAPLLSPDARVITDVYQQLASSCDGVEKVQVVLDAEASGMGMFATADGVAVVHQGVAGWGRQVALMGGVVAYLVGMFIVLRLARGGTKKKQV